MTVVTIAPFETTKRFARFNYSAGNWEQSDDGVTWEYLYTEVVILEDCKHEKTRRQPVNDNRFVIEVCLECGAENPDRYEYPHSVKHINRSSFDKPDMVNHPPHYTFGQFEVIDVIEDWGLNYHMGNAVKYVARADRKGDPIENIDKAIWYLQRERERRLGEQTGEESR